MATARKLEDDSKVNLKECNDAITDWYSSYGEHIERGRNYLTFLYVDQWDMNVRSAREAVGRPCMQFNKITTIIRSVLGEQRTNSAALTVRGVGKDVKQADVDIRDGLIRQICYDSDADVVFQIARKHAMEVGWGAGRVITEYEKEGSFLQRLRILPIMDFQAAFWDAMAELPDKSDGNFCGVYTAMDKAVFMRTHPEIEDPQSVAPDGTYFVMNWSTREVIVMAEIYIKKWFKRKIVQLSDGKAMEKEEADEVLEKQKEAMENTANDLMFGFEPLEIVNEREEDDYQIKHVKFIGNKILEETDYQGKILPIVYCQGDSTVIDGQQIPIPFITDAIDNQKLINYLGSELAYAVVRARKETIIGTADHFKGYEDDWRNSDQVQGPLRYVEGKGGTKPEFITPPIFNNSMLDLYQSNVADLEKNIGWHDEAQGAETNANSGRAINARQTASKYPVNVYEDNGNRFQRQIGKILLEMIPHVYDTQRDVAIRTQDNQVKPVTLNEQRGYRMNEGGEIEPNIVNDMSFGKYDVEIRVDGSYDAQMATAMDILIRLATINPQISNLIPDLMAENSGLKNTPQLIKRLRTLLPPDILAEEEGRPAPPPQPNPMAELENKKIELEQQKIMNERQANEIKSKQLLIDEQQAMIDAHIAGLDHDASMKRAEAEVIKATTEKDTALIDHANKIHETAFREPKPQVTYKKKRKISQQ